MIVPLFKKLVYTDFAQDMQAMIQQLANSLNPAITALISAVNGNLTLANNLACTVATTTLNVTSSGTPSTTASFSIGNNNTITGLMVIKAINNTNGTVYPTSGIFISYTQSGNTITINNITGLPTGNQFTLTVVAWLT